MVDHSRKNLTWVGYCILFLISAFILIAPLNRGLFNGGFAFEQPIYAFILLFSAGGIFTLWVLARLRQEDFNLSLFYVLLIPLTYLISYNHSISAYSAENYIYINVLHFFLFMAGFVVSGFSNGMKLLTHIIVIVGYFYVAYGLLNVTGFIYFQDAVLSGRLSNTFQYPNSYAAYLIGLFFSSIILLLNSKKIKYKFFHATFILPILLSFLLTYSRGAYLLLPIIFIFFLCFYNFRKQLEVIIYSLVAIIASLTLFKYLAEEVGKIHVTQVQANTVGGGVTLLLSSALVAILICLIKLKFFTSTEGLKVSRLTFPLAFLVLFLIFLLGFVFGKDQFTSYLPNQLQERIEGIDLEQKSASQRVVFIKDSLEITKDHFLFGAGGGAWASLYQKYQSYPYTSRQAHAFFFQLLNETGFLGLLCASILFGYVLINYGVYYFKRRLDQDGYSIVCFMIVLSILAHSWLDFDMSFVFLSGLVFLMLGSMASTIKTNTRIKKINIVRITYCSIFFIIVIASFVFSTNSLKANKEYLIAIELLQRKQNANKILNKLEESINLRRNHAQSNILRLQILSQLYAQSGNQDYYLEIMSSLKELRPKDLNNRVLLDLEFSTYLINGQEEEALKLLQDNMVFFRWDITIREKIIDLSFKLGQGNGDKSYWDNAVSLYEKIKDEAKTLENLPPSLKRHEFYGITGNIGLIVGKILYYNGDYNASLVALEEGLYRVRKDLDIVENRQVAIWYLAVLEKAKRGTDNKLLAELKTYDINVEATIKDIINKQ